MTSKGQRRDHEQADEKPPTPPPISNRLMVEVGNQKKRKTWRDPEEWIRYVIAHNGFLFPIFPTPSIHPWRRGELRFSSPYPGFPLPEWLGERYPHSPLEMLSTKVWDVTP